MVKRLIEIIFWGLAIAVICLPAALAAYATRDFTNRLNFYEDWESAKSTLAFPTMGTESFVEGRQALAGNAVDLSAWHGFQEVRLSLEQPTEEINFRVQVAEDGYIATYFLSVGAERYGLCLSRLEAYPSRWFVVDDEGKFVETLPLAHAPLGDAWFQITIRTTADGVVAEFEGTSALFPKPVTGFNVVGFRGSQVPVYVDDIVVRFRDGTMYAEDFSGSDHVLAHAGVIASLWSVSLLVVAAVVWGRARSLRIVAFSWVLAGFCATLLAGYACVWTVRTAPLYPPQESLRLASDEWIREQADLCDVEILSRYDATAEMPHVLVMGTSQTRGEGAGRFEDTYVAELEAVLRARHPEIPVVCLAMGYKAGESPLLLNRYTQFWMDQREPDVVFLNLSNNDLDQELYRENLLEFARIFTEANIPVAFITEPNAPPLNPFVADNHAIMRDAAREADVPVIEMHEHLLGLYDTGFLWWDFVHPTSYGHALIGEYLATKIEELGMLEALREAAR